MTTRKPDWANEAAAALWDATPSVGKLIPLQASIAAALRKAKADGIRAMAGTFPDALYEARAKAMALADKIERGEA